MSLIFVGQQFIIKSKQLITFNVPPCPFTTWNALNRFFRSRFVWYSVKEARKLIVHVCFPLDFQWFVIRADDSWWCYFWKSFTIERSFKIYHIAIRPDGCAFRQIDVEPFIETFKADSSFLAGVFSTLFYLRRVELYIQLADMLTQLNY